MITYTLLFIIFSTVAFLPWIITGSSFVWNIDGIHQHYPALLYLGRYIRETIQGIFSGQFTIKLWDLRLGLGSDIIGTMNYYCLGDPLDLLIGFVPARFTEFGYDALIVLRIYLAGLSFSAFAFYKKINKSHIYIGAFFYIFTCYVMMYGIKHPLFINPLIYFPLLLIGLDKLIKKERSILFTVMIAISLASNFYFFYIITIALCIYAIYRIFNLYKEHPIKELFVSAIKCALYYILGVAIACVLIIPMLNSFLDTSRAQNAVLPGIFYAAKYYIGLLSTSVGFGTIDAQTNLGFFSVGLFLFMAFIQIKNKKFFVYKLFSAIILIGLLFPIFGFAMTGFSYVANRWVFIIAFVLGMGLIRAVESFEEINLKKLIFPAIFVAATIIAIIIDRFNITTNLIVTLVVMVIGIITLAIIVKTKPKKTYLFIILMAFMVAELGVKSVSLFFYDVDPIVPDQFTKVGETYDSTCKNALRRIKANDNGIYRIDSFNEPSSNYALISDTPSITSYYSITPASITETMFKLENSRLFSTNWIKDFAGRTGLMELASVKYYICRSTEIYNHSVPYNYKYIGKDFSKVDKNDCFYIYKNTNPLPLVYGYDNIISEDKWDKLHATEKEQSMLQAAVVDDKSLVSSKIKETTPKFYSKEVLSKDEILKQLSSQKSDSFYVDGDKIIVKYAPTEFKLNFNALNNSETYFDMDEINYTKLSDKQFADVKKEYSSTPALQKKYKYIKQWFETMYMGGMNPYHYQSFNYCSKYYIYKGPQSAMCNLGYSKDGNFNPILQLGGPGTFSFKNLRIISNPMDHYNDFINKLKLDVSNIKMNNNSLSCNVNNSKQKLVCIAIPYSKGWTATVDGRPTKLFKINGMYTGLNVSKGKHKIEMHYSSSGLKIGALISMVGILITIIVFIIFKKKKTKQ